MSLDAQILAALEAASSPDSGQRVFGEQQLLALRSDPSAYFSACARVLMSPNNSLHGRQLVGYQLKNNLSHPACANNPTLQAAVCEQAVVDPVKPIRAVACAIISRAVRDNLWPIEPVVRRLTLMLTQQQHHGDHSLPAAHGAMRALSQIVDDCIYLLDTHHMTVDIVQAVLPLVTHTAWGNDAVAIQVRTAALDIVIVVLEQAGVDFNSFTYRSLHEHILVVIEACFTVLQSPPSPEAAAKCVTCLVLSLAFYQTISDDLFARMVNLMLAATMSPRVAQMGEQLHIEATQFWSAVLHFPHFAELVEPHIEKIIPTLVQAMVYSDLEKGMLQASAEDWQVPDKLDDIKPRHFQARQPTSARAGNAQNGSESNNNDNTDTANIDNDDEGDEDDEVEEWNLRRVSARTLDDISEYYGERILLPVLRVLDDWMQSSRSWQELEAAVLALGAICDGCFNALLPYLPAITTRLCELLVSPTTHFLVVNIALWTCSQVGRYFVNEEVQLCRVMEITLGKMQNPSKLVQGSAVSTLQTLVSLCDDGQQQALLHPHLRSIVTCVAQCLRGYQLKNRVLLLEVLESLCKTMGEQMRLDGAVVATLMDPLMEMWRGIPNDSPLLFSFFTCMSTVCSALGPLMEPIGKDIFERAYGILREHMHTRHVLQDQNNKNNSSEIDEPEVEFVITAADLLSGLFDALGSGLEPLMAQYQPQFMHVVLTMLRDECAEVRQSGFSLTGDVSNACPTYMQAVLAPFCEAAQSNLVTVNESNYGVVSNVAWTLCNLLERQVDTGELLLLQNTPAMPQLYAFLARILSSASLTAEMRNMADNVALCLGWMLYVDPEVEGRANCPVALFARRFCEYVRNIKDVPQKETAVSGFLVAVQRDPRIAAEHLTVFFDLACSITSANADTLRTMQRLLQHVRSTDAHLWQQRLAVYSEQPRLRLYEIYGLN